MTQKKIGFALVVTAVLFIFPIAFGAQIPLCDDGTRAQIIWIDNSTWYWDCSIPASRAQIDSQYAGQSWDTVGVDCFPNNGTTCIGGHLVEADTELAWWDIPAKPSIGSVNACDKHTALPAGHGCFYGVIRIVSWDEYLNAPDPWHGPLQYRASELSWTWNGGGY